ncbi:MAG: insulinase family protein [Campylobacter sp.]|nr:insulinase family protein [Campylobacter sp.]
MKKIEILVNGVNVPVIFEKDASLPVSVLRLVFRCSGHIYESKLGLANLCARVLKEGTKSRGDKFIDELEIKAVSIEASAGNETFSIEISSLKQNFSDAIRLFSELINDINLTDEVLNRLKLQIKGEIAGLESEYDLLSSLKLNSLLHPDINLKYPLLGTNESIDETSLDDIKEFFDKFLSLDNLFVVLGGDSEISEINLSEILSKFSTRNKRELKFIDTSSKPQKAIITKDSEQAYIYFGSPFDASLDERHLSLVANFILGGSGFGSRLMEEIRVKRGYAYSVYSRAVLNPSMKKFSGYLQTKNENKDDAIEIIKDEIAKFIQNGVNSNELKQAQNFLLGSVVLQKETMFKRLNIGQNEFYNGYKFGDFENELEKIKNLKLDELNAFIKARNELSLLSFAILCDGKS